MTNNPVVELVARTAYNELYGPGAAEHGQRFASKAWLKFRDAIAAALNHPQPGPNDALVEALEPFAACVDQISPDEDDEEWAKFRLLVKDYRRAANALWPSRNGFARCPTCKAEFDEGEWNASTHCPECEEPKVSALSSVKSQSG